MVKESLEGYLAHLSLGLEAGQMLQVPAFNKEIRTVVFAGGGSAATGVQIIQSLIVEEANIPVIVVSAYQLPAFVNEDTLVIALSDSTASDVIDSLTVQAYERKATVVWVSGEKHVTEPAQQAFAQINIPEDFVCSSRAIGYTIIQVLFAFKQWQLISDRFVSELKAAIDLIDKREYFLQDSAKSLALGLKDKWPVLYGDAKFEPVLRRFQQQLNQISQQTAHVGVFPEIMYTEKLGWIHPQQLLHEAMIVLVTSPFDHPEVQKQIETIRQALYSRSGGIADVMLLRGKSFLEQVFYVIHLFDWTAFFLARENKEESSS